MHCKCSCRSPPEYPHSSGGCNGSTWNRRRWILRLHPASTRLLTHPTALRTPAEVPCKNVQVFWASHGTFGVMGLFFCECLHTLGLPQESICFKKCWYRRYFRFLTLPAVSCPCLRIPCRNVGTNGCANTAKLQPDGVWRTRTQRFVWMCTDDHGDS